MSEREKRDGAADRRIRTPGEVAHLAFDERGLVPVVAQDAASGDVLMLGWAGADALERSLESGHLHFWSRSRGELWRKGETSGHVLELVSLHADCDGDAVLARVRPAGPACHTGDTSCFGRATAPEGARHVLDALWSVLEERERSRPPGSHTTRLLEDENLRLKKLGEEGAELLTALSRNERERIPEEAADLLYHVMVALLGSGVGFDRVRSVLENRRKEG